MTRILVTALVGAVLSGLLGYLLIPMLRALKVGQSIREVGPIWHNYKAGTPMMGGLMFIFASIIVLLCNLPFMEDYSVLYVLILSLCFGFVGFVDDYAKLRKRQNEGLTSSQKFMLQLAVSALFLYIMYRSGAMSTEMYIPLRWCQHPPASHRVHFPVHVHHGGLRQRREHHRRCGRSEQLRDPARHDLLHRCCH